MRLIIGPTSAGKSSYIQGLTVEGAAKPKVYFAHQIQKSGNIPTGNVSRLLDLVGEVDLGFAAPSSVSPWM